MILEVLSLLNLLHNRTYIKEYKVCREIFLRPNI